MNDLITKIGALHPLVLHFPVALIVLLCLIELLYKDRDIRISWFIAGLAALTSCVASATGWLNAEGSSFTGDNAETVFWHRYLALAMTGLILISFIALTLAKAKDSAKGMMVFRVSLFAACLVLFPAADFGGTLVHGNILEVWFPKAKEKTEEPKKIAMTTVDFHQDIWPIIENRCLKCHGAKKQKGDLRLDTRKHAFAGGESGASILPYNPEKSSFYTLAALPADDDDIMPAKGDPLTSEQLSKVKLWIEMGADWPSKP